MSYSRQAFRSPLIALAMLVVWAGYLAESAPAQQQRPNKPQRRDNADVRHPDGGPKSPWTDGIPGGNLFKPLPQDEGPLTAAERKELEQFLKQRAPRIYRQLRQIRQRDPAEFERRVQEAAPRLRTLRRIFERNPRLGRNVLRYAENRHRLYGAQRALADAGQDAARQRRVRNAIRRLLAENLRIETAVLDDRVSQIEKNRDAWIDAQLERLVAPGVDLAGEPPRVRELVRQLRNSSTDEERQAVASRLRAVMAGRVEQDVNTLRRRVTQMRSNAAAEVDRRLTRFAKTAQQRPTAAPRIHNQRDHQKHQRGKKPRGKKPRGKGRGRHP